VARIKQLKGSWTDRVTRALPRTLWELLEVTTVANAAGRRTFSRLTLHLWELGLGGIPTNAVGSDIVGE
jgi:hypothetical protein